MFRARGGTAGFDYGVGEGVSWALIFGDEGRGEGKGGEKTTARGVGVKGRNTGGRGSWRRPDGTE